MTLPLDVRLQAAERALATVTEAMKVRRPHDVSRDLRIMRFSYTFEAVWRVAQKLLVERHATRLASPKQVVRALNGIGIIEERDLSALLAMCDDRDPASFVEDDKTADLLAVRIEGHMALLARWLAAMRAELSKAQ